MSTHVLDHIVHLTPPGTVEEASAEFQRLGFSVIPGGTHAGGMTYNALVVLPDGVYLELIAFTSSPPPRSHRWGAATPGGWIDFANLGLEHDVARTVNGRAAADGSGTRYLPGVDGGRETPAGRVLQWRVTQPDPSRHGVGSLPFFCGDVTPREWRVPAPENHASGARGVSYVKVQAASVEQFETLLRQFTTVLNVRSSGGAEASRRAVWPLDTPNSRQGLQTQLILTLEEGAQTAGIQEVGFWVEDGREGKADSKFGNIVWVPIS
ncbi:glyoxalase-like domain-containing protein [Hysterangium stoloniferum]|nr:glyoxalase-like domain-containing protein [Hysterangium stoloniferum]